MKKIPTMFERDWNGDRSRVLDQVNESCRWVFAGEGVATRKYDGMCTAIINGVFYKRREVKPGQTTPHGWIPVMADDETGKEVGWVPVGNGPEDRYLLAAFDNRPENDRDDGTYEFLGPKSQGNIEKFDEHRLVKHRDAEGYQNVPRTFNELCAWLECRDIEGLVFHHPDGRMAKIKKRDFGQKR